MAPSVRLPSIDKLLVTCVSPLTVKFPPVTFTFPDESMLNLSLAACEEPVIKDSLVALLNLLKLPSDFATIEAATILEASPVPSSGAWNSILPRRSSPWISVEDVCNFNTAPAADLDTILSVVVDPLTWRSVVVILPLPVTLLKPDTLLLLSTDTTRSPDITPATTFVNKLISLAVAVTSVPPRLICPVVNLPSTPMLLNPITSFCWSTITALPATTAPGVISSSLLISSAIAVILTPPISSVSALNSPVIVMLLIPVMFLPESITTAFSAEAVPGVTPSRYPSSVLENELPPSVRLPSIFTSAENCALSLAVILPTKTSANPSTVTEPAVLPSSKLEDTKANESDDSWYISDLFNVLVVMPSPRVNTIPKSWVDPIFPSPSFIILSATVKLVAWVVTTFPDTVKSPTIDVSPLTVKLSPIVTSEVACPRLITEFSSCVPMLIAPEDLMLAFVPSKNKFISELFPKIMFLPSANFIESALNWPTVSTATSEEVPLPVNLRISASKTPIELWSDDIVVTPLRVFISKLSPFSPLLSLTSLILGVPSDALDAFINNSGLSLSTNIFPATFIGFIIVNPATLVVSIFPLVNLISASVESEPPVIEPLIVIPELVVICPLNVTSPPNTELPETLISPSRRVFPPETRKAFAFVSVMLFPADGAPLTCNVEALVVVTLVKVEARVAPLKEYISVASTTEPAPADVLVYIWSPSIPESNIIAFVASLNDLVATSSFNPLVIVLLIVSCSCDVILPVLVILLIPTISDEESTTIAFSAVTWPSVIPDNLLRSVAVASTNVEPSWSPASTPLWDNTLIILDPLEVPKLISPVNPCVTTFPLADCPKVTPLIEPIVLSEIDSEPITKLPPTVKSLVNVAEPASIEPDVWTLLVPILIVAVSLVIEPSAIVMSPNLESVAAVIVPLVVILLVPILIVAVSLVIDPSDIVISPNLELVAAVIVPVVVTLLVPIVIVALSLVIEPSAIVTSPILVPEAAVTVPVVVILLVPILMVAVSLVIEPSAIVTSPNFDPVAPVITPVVVTELLPNDIALVEDVIALPLIFILPISAVPLTVILEDEVIAPTVISPAVKSPEEIVPDVEILLVPMLIVAVSLVIEPSAIVTSPILDPEADCNVDVSIAFLPIISPVVDILLAPMLNVALSLVIEPSAIVISPILVPEAEVIVPVVLIALSAKSTSLVVEVILSPFIVTLPNVTDPATFNVVLQINEFNVTSPRVDWPEDSRGPILTGTYASGTIFPLSEPAAWVDINVNLLSISSQIIPTLIESPLSINIPVSKAASPTVSLARTIIGSVTDMFWESIIVVSPVTTRFPVTVKFPLSSVPLVERFSSPKSIPLPSEVIELLATTILPKDEPVAPFIVPEVSTLLVPILIVAVSLVIDPSAIVTSPNLEPLAAVTVEVTTAVPVTERLPVETVPVVDNELSENPIALLESVMLPLVKVKLPIVEPDVALIVELNWALPFTVNPSDTIFPVTLAPLFILATPPTVSPAKPTIFPVTLSESERFVWPVIVVVPLTFKEPAEARPVVVIELLPKLIALPESVIKPSEKVKLPNFEPLAAVTVESEEIVPETLKVLLILVSSSTITFPPKCDIPSFTHIDLALVKVILFPLVGGPAIYTVEALVVVTLSFSAVKLAGLNE